MREGFQKISEVIEKKPELANIRNILKQADVVNDFEKIFPELTKIAEAVRVDKKCIYIRAHNASWRSELKFGEQQLINKINNFYKEERIKYVRFIT